MFDVAYENEVFIAVAEIVKDRFWQKILKLDLSEPLAGFAEMCTIHDMNSIIEYRSIMYYTHGV